MNANFVHGSSTFPMRSFPLGARAPAPGPPRFAARCGLFPRARTPHEGLRSPALAEPTPRRHTRTFPHVPLLLSAHRFTSDHDPTRDTCARESHIPVGTLGCAPRGPGALTPARCSERRPEIVEAPPGAPAEANGPRSRCQFTA
jgi:hypothetical protein